MIAPEALPSRKFAAWDFGMIYQRGALQRRLDALLDRITRYRNIVETGNDLRSAALAFWDGNMQCAAEAGKFRISTGNS